MENKLIPLIKLIALRNSCISGRIFALLKGQSGSLLRPAITHDVEDFVLVLPKIIKSS
jgi:hypothetical protein